MYTSALIPYDLHAEMESGFIIRSKTGESNLKNRLKALRIGSLFGRLVASYLWLIIVPVALIGWMSFKASENILMTKISESNGKTMNQIDRNIRTLLDQVTAVVNMNNLNQSLETYLSKGYANPYDELIDKAVVEKNMLQASLAFDWMQFESYMIGKNGQIYSQNDSSGGIDAARLLQVRQQTAVEASPDQIVWSGAQDSFLKNQEHQKVFNAVKLLYNPYTHLEYGLFILSVKEDSLYRIYRDSIGADATFFILDKDGRYVTSSRRETVGMQADPELVHELASSKETQGISTIYGKNTLTSVKYLEVPGWTLVMNVSVQSLFKDVRGLSRSILLMTLILAAVSILAAVWISRRIAMPLIRLNQRIQSYKLNGGLVQARREQPDVNELALLTTEYEQMIMKLEHTIHELVRNQEAKQAAEWNALQAQINPHFLYNTLNSIKCLVWIDKTELIEPTINALVKLLQMTVQRSENEITLREELACLEYYVYIQEIRLSRKIIFRVYVDEGLWSCRLPKLLLQPIVENAIFHGIERKPEEEGEAMITLYAAPYLSDVRIEISDNGVGMDVNQPDKKDTEDAERTKHRFSGIGMMNVHERLQMNYGDHYGLSVQSTPGQGTTVILMLPARFAGQEREGNTDDQHYYR
ncbi:cache domain-containing sensor histidine kinase [Paenibacillus hamazuiensis]|uniref:cache domain-containing sensor histidine kinase n=1 Tax=Paenibacillus hamazuiensis TaxID=2936508 RepID=UPI00200C580E|nr:sensor histidine kinase [Paenibacillus hamazuiensis]